MSQSESDERYSQPAADSPASSQAKVTPLDHNGPTEIPFRLFPDEWLERPVIDVFAETASLYWDKTAVDDGQDYFTYGEVRERVRQLAQQIVRTVGRGALVGVALPNGAKHPVAMLAALAAGSPYVPLDLSFPEARNARIFRHSGMKAAVVDRDTSAAVARMDPALPQIDFDAAAGADGPAIALDPAPDNVSFIIYTSGSTGEPKGVFHTQRNLLHHALQRTNSAHLSAADRVLLLFAPTVSVSQQDIWGTLLNGATLFVVDLRRRGLQDVLDVMRHRRITAFHTVPAVFRRLLALAHEDDAFATVRSVLLSTDRVFSADVHLFHQRFPPAAIFAVGLGSTEGKFFCQWFIPRGRPLTDPLIPVGYVRPGYELELVDDGGGPVPRGEIGEIIIKSRYIALGYWNDAETTRKMFSVAPEDPRSRVFRSGDLGRFRADGLLDLIGRKDRQLKIRGQRVEPGEIEAAIRTHPAVSDAAVIARPVAETHAIIAFVVAEKGASFGGEALAAWLGERLPSAMRPLEIHFLDALPTLGNFKQDLKALEELDRRHAAAAALGAPVAAAAAPPSDAEREAVRQAWSRLVGARSYDADKSWEGAGGDSLQALELLFELESVLGRRVTHEVLDPATRPSELVARLAAAPRGEAAAPRPRVFLLPGVNGLDINDMRIVNRMRADFRLHVVQYPPIDPAGLAAIAYDREFDDIVGDSLRQIAAASDGEPIRLLGYSFGGLVAYEMARVLAAQGRRVAFLGILDATPLMTSRTSPYLRDVALWRRLAENMRAGRLRVPTPLRFFEVAVATQLVRRHYGLIAALWWLGNRVGWRRGALTVRMAATRYAHALAAKLYRPKPYPGLLCLIRASEAREWDASGPGEELGWEKLCPDVAVTRVAGDHVSIMSAVNVETTVRAVVAALDQHGAIG